MVDAFPELGPGRDRDFPRRINLDVIDRAVRVRPNPQPHAVRFDHDGTRRQIQGLAKRLLRPERTGVQRDPDPSRLEDVPLVRVGIVLGQQQEQVAAFDGIHARGDIAVADRHHATGVFRRRLPDDVIAAHPLGGSLG
jgi:hypothetical protein